MYRRQRHFYDLTRRYYLFGRDRMLRRLPLGPDVTVLEIGCGTARNLIRLARRRSGARLFGVDASGEMLKTAAARLAHAGLDGEVSLAQAAAQAFDPRAAFAVRRFDVVLFSYVLSMIPDWQGAVASALDLLRPGGTLAAVDFTDQSTAPAWRRGALLAWLRQFDVHPRGEIEAGLRRMPGTELASAEHVLGGYAYLLLLRKQHGAVAEASSG